MWLRWINTIIKMQPVHTIMWWWRPRFNSWYKCVFGYYRFKYLNIASFHIPQCGHSNVFFFILLRILYWRILRTRFICMENQSELVSCDGDSWWAIVIFLFCVHHHILNIELLIPNGRVSVNGGGTFLWSWVWDSTIPFGTLFTWPWLVWLFSSLSEAAHCCCPRTAGRVWGQ